MPKFALAGAIVLLCLGSCQDPRAMAVELCGNGLDEDLDGRIDCADEDCDTDPRCLQPPASVLGAFRPLDDDSTLGRALQSDCVDEPREKAAEFRTGAQRPDCQLLADSCGFGRRCVVLSRQRRVLRSRCVRQGCAEPLDRCDLSGLTDRCGRHTLCLDLPALCGQGACCVPLCSLSGKDPFACEDCRPLSSLFDGPWPRNLKDTGLCLEDSVF